MGLSIDDYLIEQSTLDWPSVLSTWSWLLPRESSLWLVNRFADLFLVLSDGTVHMLDVGGGTLSKVAENREDFCTRIDDQTNADGWLMIPLVDKLVSAGILLQPGQCYGLKLPPVLGGEYAVENIGPLPIGDYLGAYGSIHEQLRDVPHGTEVVLKLDGNPD